MKLEKKLSSKSKILILPIISAIFLCFSFCFGVAVLAFTENDIRIIGIQKSNNSDAGEIISDKYADDKTILEPQNQDEGKSHDGFGIAESDQIDLEYLALDIEWLQNSEELLVWTALGQLFRMDMSNGKMEMVLDESQDILEMYETFYDPHTPEGNVTIHEFIWDTYLLKYKYLQTSIDGNKFVLSTNDSYAVFSASNYELIDTYDECSYVEDISSKLDLCTDGKKLFTTNKSRYPNLDSINEKIQDSNAIEFSPDGSKVLVTVNDAQLDIWDVEL